MSKIKKSKPIQLSWKSLRDMANKGIGHSNLNKIALKVKKQNKKK